MSADLKSVLLDLRYRIDAEDKDHTIVYSLEFEHAVRIITA
jgi:hypothetical protein